MCHWHHGGHCVGWHRCKLDYYQCHGFVQIATCFGKWNACIITMHVDRCILYTQCIRMYHPRSCVCVCVRTTSFFILLFTLLTLHSSLDSFWCFIMFDQCSSETHTLRCHQLPGILGVHWNHGQEVLCCVHHRLGGGCQLHRDPGSVFESSNHRRVGEMR